MRDNEIATICYVCFGKRPHGRSVRRVLEANPTAIRMFRRFKPFHEIKDVIERRLAIVTLHSEGWNVKSIAGYLKTSRPTVYRTLNQWIAENVYSLEYKPRGAKSKVDLRAMNEVRKLQENPELGEFRISAALAQLGIHLSPRTCGRILAVNRKLYGLEKPKRGSKEWVEQYNTQMHWAHRQRKEGKRSPAEVLGFLTSVRHRPEDLERAFFSTRFTRVLDSSGYARIRHWKIYAEEGLANREVVLWLGSEVLAVEYAGEPLARYDVEYSPRTKNLREVKKPQLFETSHRFGVAQLRLFELEALGEIGWLRALRLDEYSPRNPRRSQVLQQTLFACSEAP